MKPKLFMASFTAKWIGAMCLCMAKASLVQAGSLWLPSVFSEGMVLQREMPVPVWGRAAPGADVTVSMIAQTGVHFQQGGKPLATATTTACPKTGRWRVTLSAMPAGGRHTLLLVARGPTPVQEETLLFSDVWIGEVWIVCGQSNMIFPMSSCGEDDRGDALAHLHEFPNIRFAEIGLRRAREVTEPIENPEGYWGPAKWETATYAVPRSSTTDVPGSMSGIAYFFARSLSRWLGADIPVGILVVGAILPVESWVDDAVAADVPELAHLRGKGYPHATGRAFNANIAPLAPFAIRGVVYGQSSMNADRPADYYHGLKAMVVSWRRAWNRADLPFLLVQPPGFIKHLGRETALDMDPAHLAMFNDQNAGHPFCLLREAQLRVSREVPHVGMIVTLDQGEKYEIHPPLQRVAGDRLGLLARTRAYGDSTLRGESPRPRTIRRLDKRFQITFDGAESGLVAHGELAGFEVRDANGIWHPSQAAIDGDTVEAWSDAIPEPAGVRYAWAGYPPVTLFTKDGLPAAPFQYPPVELPVNGR